MHYFYEQNNINTWSLKKINPWKCVIVCFTNKIEFQVSKQLFLKYMQLLILLFIIPTMHAKYSFIDLGKSNNSHGEMIEIGFL